MVDGLPEEGNGAGGEDIFAIPTTGSPRTMRPAVANRFDEESGEVSPDGRWIAYVSNETGTDQVYIQPFLTTGGRTLVSAGHAAEPVWVSNSELAYIDYESDSLTVARLTFGTSTTVKRTSLLDTRNYVRAGRRSRNFDVSRDGQRFIFLKRPDGAARAEPIVATPAVHSIFCEN